MADHSITVSDSLNLFGGGPTSLWGAHNWGAFQWGEGTVEFSHDILHAVENSLSPSTSESFRVFHYLDGETLSPDASPALRFTRVLRSESISFDAETTEERLSDGSGYTYVYISDATNAEDRDDITWTSAAAGVNPWSTASATSTTWS